MPAKARIIVSQKGQKSADIKSIKDARIRSNMTLSYFEASFEARPV